MKEIFFLAGLQRSGATVLSSILNQNPDLWVSPASPMLQMMINATQTFDSFEHKDYDRGNAISNAIAAIPQNFYYDKQANYIIDKNLNWTSVNGVEVAHRYINQNIKIICPVRDILDILVSFDTIINAHPDSQQNALMDKEVLLETFPDKPMADRRADWLMKFGNDIMRCLNNMKHAMNPEYRHLFHFVEYVDLTTNPQKEINKIYEYLEIPQYNHEYQNIEDSSGISENSLTGIKNLHKVRPKLEKKSRKPEDVFLPETIQRYSGLEFWRGTK
jgi:sulfotransferase